MTGGDCGIPRFDNSSVTPFLLPVEEAAPSRVKSRVLKPKERRRVLAFRAEYPGAAVAHREHRVAAPLRIEQTPLKFDILQRLAPTGWTDLDVGDCTNARNAFKRETLKRHGSAADRSKCGKRQR